jgi:hypothetical protein
MKFRYNASHIDAEKRKLVFRRFKTNCQEHSPYSDYDH